VVARGDGLAGEGDVRVARRRGAHSNHDFFRRGFALARTVHKDQANGVRINKFRGSIEQLDAVAKQLVPDDINLVAYHLVGAVKQVGDGDVFLDRVGLAVKPA